MIQEITISLYKYTTFPNPESSRAESFNASLGQSHFTDGESEAQ